MKRIFQTTRASLAGLALAGAMTHEAAAQFVAANNYQQQQQPAYQTTQPRSAQPAPQYAANPYQGQPAAPTYGYPRVAQANDLPAPAESVEADGRDQSPEVTPAPAQQPSVPPTPAPPSSYEDPERGYDQPASQTSYPSYPSYAAPQTTDAAPIQSGTDGSSHVMATPTTDYYGDPGACAPSPAYGAAPDCNLGLAAKPRRQWFGGVYGLYLTRGGDQGKAAVAYLTDTATFVPGDNYYHMPSDPTLFTTDADQSGLGGAEIRFGSTFGQDECNGYQPFAWEVGYWGLVNDESSATLLYPGMLSSANTMRLYSLYNYYGLTTDLDGSGGAAFDERPIYTDPGDPADGDVTENDVRILGVRVRQRFSAQNLELNFWRFGTPTQGISLGKGGCRGGACGVDPCGVDPCGCEPASCGPPRRFFINGLAGVRYLRVDDDFGVDWPQSPINTTTGDPPAGWPTEYEGFPQDDNSVLFSDFQATNELVGFQLGCSMNWLVGCNWNFFADSNFGIYGNNVDVYKRVYGGGDSMVRYANGGGDAIAQSSDTVLSYVGELRAGVGYQVTCNCRLTAAYRFMGIGGVALGGEEFQNTNWANPMVASHFDANNSIILHGLQTGVEFKY